VRLILRFHTALLILSVSAPMAGAQVLHVPRVEVGGQGGMLGAIGDGVHLTPTVGPRVTINFSQQDAIELAADTILRDGSQGINGLYFLQYKRTTRGPLDWSGIRPFFTLGTGGYYAYRKNPERRYSRPDGSVVVYPAHSNGEVSGLNLATFGGGFERGLNRHTSFRIEGTGAVAIHDDGFLAFRILAGVSVPIGGYRANTFE
jgi:hypothetical protein